MAGESLIDGTVQAGQTVTSRALGLVGQLELCYEVLCRNLQSSPSQIRFRFEDLSIPGRTLHTFYGTFGLQKGTLNSPPPLLRIWAECLLGRAQFSLTKVERDLPVSPPNVSLRPGSVVWVNEAGQLSTLENGAPSEYFGTDAAGEPGFHILPSGGSSTHQHAWNEVPSGLMDGVNKVYTLLQIPTPYESLMLFRNGLCLRLGGDYTIIGSIVTMTRAPNSGENFLASYTYMGTR